MRRLRIPMRALPRIRKLDPLPVARPYPGVYIEEVQANLHIIAGVPTSITLFIGWSPQGPTDRAVRITGFADYEREFGGLRQGSFLGYAVRHFFDNGGKDAYVLRLAADGTEWNADDADFRTAVLDSFGPGTATDGIDLFNLLCVPGLTDPGTIAALQTHCRRRRAFLIVDAPEGASVSDMENTGVSGLTGPDASHSALYYPWVRAADPLDAGAQRAFPPCGFVAGVYARTDASRGVWKAPAGTGAGIGGAASPEHAISDAGNGLLNRLGINCLRAFPGHGLMVWGARTLQGHEGRGPEWRYVPVKRLALLLEESVDRGTQWAASEPNDAALWARVRQGVEAFMQDLFRRGAFQGSTSREAYFVRCGRETTSQADIDQGVVNILVGFAPLKPAEFVIINLQQAAGQTAG